MKKILIVEDNALLRDNISEILSLEGYVTVTAQDGQHGIEMALAENPDLIISDVNMPNKDGYQMLQELREIEETQLIPFIFLTVKNTMDDLRVGMNLGADDYIAKPFEMEELLKAVENRLSKREAVVKKEVEKYDQLQDGVGEIISKVIDDPLKSIERLSALLNLESAELTLDDITEISRIINDHAQELRSEITHIMYYHKIMALKDQPKELAKLKKEYTHNTASHIKNSSTQRAGIYQRESDLISTIKDSSIQMPAEFLSYIISELVDNAFKYSPNDTKVKVSANEIDKIYEIIVQDRGIGFPYANVSSYSPYMRNSQTNKLSDGLGLSLVNIRNIIDLFNGEISVSSDPEIGTSFKVSLPVLD
jgi:DNA-binding response OmpR family regulator